LVEADKEYNVVSRFTRGYEVVAADIAEADGTQNSESKINRYYYTVDEHGSTTLITDKYSNIKNEYHYDAFGNVLESKEQVHNRITYAGQQFDGITGQYYLRARFYNPVIGRFTQEDIYRGDGLNLYAYCSNNPIVYYDFSGYALCSKNKKRIFNNYQKLREQGFTPKEAYDYMKEAKKLQTHGEKDIFGENFMHDIMENKRGYEKLPSHVEGNHGIDGVYVKRDANGNINDLVIGEAKFGNSRLNKNTSMGPQMSKKWVEANIKKMMKSNNKATREAGEELMDFLDSGGNYDRILIKIKKSGYSKVEDLKHLQ
jgi:RHS repeat-associated protein